MSKVLRRDLTYRSQMICPLRREYYFLLMKGAAMLSDKSIEEFQRLYKNRYGEDISKEKAEELGGRLLNFVKLLQEFAMREVKEGESTTTLSKESY